MTTGFGTGGGKRVPWSLAVILILVFSTGVWAAGPVQVFSDRQGSKRINLDVGKSIIIRSTGPITRVSSANEQVATVMGLSPTQVYVTGKSPGETNVTLWQGDDRISAVYDIEVSRDTSRLKQQLHELFPNEQDIRVLASHDSLTLWGSVSSAANLSKVLAITQAYAGEKKLINLLQVSGVNQVMLEIRVAEMSRTLTKRLAIDFVASNEGSIGTSLLGKQATINKFIGGREGGSLDLKFAQSVNALFHIVGGGPTWTAFLDALKEDGLIKVLAEPTLITLSGQTATFLAGGEFPVPIPQGLGTVAIEYKPFGVSLSFTPTVLSEDKISMKVAPEVSELDFTTAIVLEGFTIPGLTTRRVSTVIELGDGESFAIAGLLRENIRESIAKFPLLGDVPILGTLFRSSSFQKNETELIIIATPHLVRPINASKQALPTDGYTEPSDTELFLKGLLQGQAKAPPSSPIHAGGRNGLEGEFGHTLPQ